MEYFYFGRKNSLLGIYAEGNKHVRIGKDICVIIFNPIGKELIRTYSTFRRLADILVTHGINVFRFDYYGTGDSKGDSIDLTIKSITLDIETAIKEVTNNMSNVEVVLIGCRLGATFLLAHDYLTAGFRKILWHPVLDGESYINEQKVLHNKELKGSFECNKILPNNELFGYIYSDRFISEICELDISKGLRNFSNTYITTVDSIPIDLRGYVLDNLDFVCSQNYGFWYKNVNSESDESNIVTPNNDIKIICDLLIEK